MPLPELELSYEYESNKYRSSGDDWTRRRYLILDFVTVMTSWASNPWTVVASSNAVTAGWPGPGWSSISDIVRAYGTNPHSWIVLENPVCGAQVCIEVEGVNDGLGSFYTSMPGNFTGGSTTTPPLSGATYLTNTYRATWFCAGTATDWRGHFHHATNGEADFYSLTNSTNSMWYFFFGKAGDPDSGWSFPWFCSVAPTASGSYRMPRIVGSYSDGWGQPVTATGAFAVIQHVSPTPTNHAWLRVCAEVNEDSYCAALNSCQPNTLSGEQSMYPLNLYGFSAGDYGVHGRIRDVYLAQRFGIAPYLGDADTLETDPANPSYEWAVWGDFAFPHEPGVQPLM